MSYSKMESYRVNRQYDRLARKCGLSTKIVLISDETTMKATNEVETHETGILYREVKND